MMKKFLLILLFIATNSYADWDDPMRKFSMNNNRYNKVLVNLVPTADVQGICERESRRRGKGGFGFSIQACSFWEESNGYTVCTIVVNDNVTMHSLGHEMLHCLQGNWH